MAADPLATKFTRASIGDPTSPVQTDGSISVQTDARVEGALTVVGALTAASSSLTAESVTSGSPSPGATLMLYKAVPLTAANIIAMNATPVTVLAAPGASKAIVLHKVMLRVTRTSTQFTGGGTVVVNYATGPVAAISTIAAANITGAAGVIDATRYGIDAATVENDALVITNASASFATGTGTAVLHIWYSIV